jgi:hypothetical protein
MSVSSHLNPEPERRLWIIHENLRRTVEWTDLKLGALTAFAALQMALIKYLNPDGPVSYAALVLLAAILPVGVLALSPLIEMPVRTPLLEPRRDKLAAMESLLESSDISKHPQVELVNRLDKYLGGGITATPYYEDIVGQIVINARLVSRKRRLLIAACALAGVVQLALLGQLLWR